MIEDILEMERGELKLVLRGLSSLLIDEDDVNGDRLMEDEGEEGEECLNKWSYVIPDFAHASFSDYLFDSSRSGPFHVNRQEYDNQFILRSFALIMQSIRLWG